MTVTTRLTELRLKRILLAMDVSGPMPATLSFAVTLAARFEAEFQALVLAQTQLARAAALPFATEVSLLAGMERRLSTASLQRSLEGLSARLNAMITELTAPARVPWSLAPAGKSAWEELLLELGEGSLLVLGHDGHHLPVAGGPVEDGVCVLYDDSPAGHAALALADALDRRATPLHVASGDEPSATRVLARLTSLRPRILILPAAFLAQHAAALRPLLTRLGCTVLVVG
ncbi:hypothetical protein Tgr7_0260 [Thioalkalivibrio sulfidiphilus HL-EbGr7]|uniref:UspA domain-containing protein n=1 Tax=Thioalkalivibrio sulfidiphilus (strain HL-EbGR7) TaxID=396588 RepID=B8GU76_THISH|nr:hypothetical protein [Thioalkalivibrio sulfidiphilus]ACL71359.1 hypothetical protein Tgr7_0260 [Thioalkalivibrio sulfidiphilus HL-EbGr7]